MRGIRYKGRDSDELETINFVGSEQERGIRNYCIRVII